MSQSSTHHKKIVVLWWSGRMWEQIITQALARGHDVITLVRDINKVSMTHSQLTIIQWDATNSSDITKVIANCDIVIHAVSVPLIHHKPTHLYSSVTKAVIQSRPKQFAPQHYIVMSSTGTDHGRDLVWPLGWGYQLMLGDVADDKECEEQLLASSSLPRTVIKAVILTNSSSTHYHRLPFAKYCPWLQTVSRNAVATAICDIMWDTSTLWQKIVVY